MRSVEQYWDEKTQRFYLLDRTALEWCECDEVGNELTEWEELEDAHEVRVARVLDQSSQTKP